MRNAAYADLLRYRPASGLHLGNPVFQPEPDLLEELNLLLLARRLAGVDQPVDPAMTKAQFLEIVTHDCLHFLPCWMGYRIRGLINPIVCLSDF